MKHRQMRVRLFKEMIVGVISTLIGSFIVFGVFLVVNVYVRNDVLLKVAILFTIGMFLCGMGYALFLALKTLVEDKFRQRKKDNN